MSEYRRCLDRTNELLNWFARMLTQHEGRSEAELGAAAQEFFHFLSGCKHHDEIPSLENVWLRWQACPDASREEYYGLSVCQCAFPPPNTNPPWERRDTMLAVGALLASAAFLAWKDRSSHSIELAAMLLADITEIQCEWIRQYGIGECRLATPQEIRIAGIVRRLQAKPFIVQAISEFGRMGARGRERSLKTRRAEDWKKAKGLWIQWRNGELKGVATCDDFASRVQTECENLTSHQGILREERKWRREAEAARRTRPSV